MRTESEILTDLLKTELHKNLKHTRAVYDRLKDVEVSSPEGKALLKLLNVCRKNNETIWKEIESKKKNDWMKSEHMETEITLPVKVLFTVTPGEPAVSEYYGGPPVDPGCEESAEIEGVIFNDLDLADYLPERILNEIAAQALEY